MEKKIFDPRLELCADLERIGVSGNSSYTIALDAGIGVVDQKYIEGMRFKKKMVKEILGKVGAFYSGVYDGDDE